MTTESRTAMRTEEQTAQLIATGELFHTLAADPKYRRKVLGLIKEAAPATVIPELDVQADVDRQVAERVKPFEESHKTITERLAAVEARIGREGFREKFGLSEEELVEVETTAKESGITKAETAVDYWRQKQQLGTPRGTRPDAGLSAEDRKLLVKNPKAWAMKQSDRVIRELRGGRR